MQTQAWEDSFKYIDHMTAIETEESAALREIAKHMITQSPDQTIPGKQVQFDESVELAPKITAFREKMEADTLTEADVEELRAEFVKMNDAAKLYLAQGTNRRMAKQMTPFISCFRDMTQAGVSLLDSMGAIISGDSSGVWENFAEAQAVYEKSQTYGFGYYNAGTIYATAARKYVKPFTEEILKYVSDEVKGSVNPENVPLEKTLILQIGGKTSGFSVQDGTRAENATDGDLGTAYTVSPNQIVGDYVGLTFNVPVSVENIYFALSTSSHPNDYFYAGTMEYTLDGKSWQAFETQPAAGTEVELVLEAPVEIKGFRWKCTGLGSPANRWLAIREIGFNKEEEEQEEVCQAEFSCTPGWTVYQGSASNMTDGNDSTMVWYNPSTSKRDCSLVGDYIQLDLGEAKPVGRVRALIGAGNADKWTNYHLAYSVDGEEWTELDSHAGDASGTDIYEENLGGVSARYLRVVNDVEVGKWVKFSEFTAYPYTGEEVQQYQGTLVTPSYWTVSSGNLANVTDGNDSTGIHIDPTKPGDSSLKDYSQAGDYIGLDLGSEKTIGRVRVLVGNGDADKWTNYHLEYSSTGADGEWTSLEAYTGASSGTDTFEVNLGGVAARYVRLVNDLSIHKWVKFCEFSVYSYVENEEQQEEKYTAQSSCTPGWTVYQGNAGNLTDGNDNTYIWYNTTSSGNRSLPGDYLQMDLGEVKTVGRVRVLVGTGDGDKWVNYHLAYSENGEDWKHLDVYKGTASGTDIYEIDLEGVSARYLKLINNTEVNKWVKFSEFSVYSYVENAVDMDYTNTVGAGWKVRYAKSIAKVLPKRAAVLKPGEYIGLKLDRIRTVSVNISGQGIESLTFEKSVNGEEWSSGEQGAARYIRLINKGTGNVTFDLTAFTAKLNEGGGIELLEAVIGGKTVTSDARNLGTANAWMDGDLTTKAEYCASPETGNYITYDLGQERVLRSLRAYVLDTELDYPRNVKFQASLDNQSWTDIITVGGGESADAKPAENGWTHDTIDVAYAYVENADIDPLNARYIRLYFTEGYTSRSKVVLNEIQLNGGEYVPSVNDPAFETDAVLRRGYEPQNLIDGDLTTAFRPEGTEKGTLVYNLPDMAAWRRLNILQSGNVISNAKVSVRTGAETWVELGTLDRSFSAFYLGELEKIYGIKLEWENVEPVIYEIILLKNPGDIFDKNLADYERAVNAASEEVEQAEGRLSEAAAKVDEAVAAMEGLEGKELLAAEAVLAGLKAQKSKAEAVVADKEAVKAEAEAKYADTMAKSKKAQAESADSEEEKAALEQEAAQQTRTAQAKKAEAEGKRQTAEEKRGEAERYLAEQEEKQAALEAQELAEAKEALSDVIAEQTERAEADYTAVSWSRFAEALEAARTAVGSEDVTKDEIESAENALLEAAAGLKKAVKSITLRTEGNKAQIAAEETLQITADVLPADAENKAVVWTSGNESAATVNADGLVTAVAAGEAVITAEAADGSGVSGEITLTIVKNSSQIEAEELAQAKQELSDTITAQGQKVQADYTEASWKTYSDALEASRAAVNSSSVTKEQVELAKNALLEAAAGLKKAVKSITLRTEGNKAQIAAEETLQITADVLPADAENKAVVWTSGNESAATVNADGLVTAVAAGEAVITAEAADGSGVSGEITLTIVKNSSQIEVEELAQAKQELSDVIAAQPERDEADYTAESWAAYQGALDAAQTAVESTTVTKDEVELTKSLLEERAADLAKIVKSIVLRTEGDKTQIAVEETLQLTAEIFPEDAANQAVIWTSENDKIATVDENGSVTAVAAGEVTITAVSSDESGVSDRITLTIVKKGSQAAEELEEVKKELGAFIQKDEQVKKDETQYTDQSWKEYIDALEAAKKLVNSQTATKAEIEAAKDRLEKAVQGLTVKQPEPVPAPEPQPSVPAVGKTIDSGILQFRVTKSDAKNGTVTVSKLKNKKAKSIKIPAEIMYNGYIFKVTAVNAKVFQKCKKLASVEIGSNVTRIGSNAFYGSKKLKKITFKGKKAPKFSGKKVFKGTAAKCKVTVPKKMSKKQLNLLKKRMKKAGISKKASYKKK